MNNKSVLNRLMLILVSIVSLRASASNWSVTKDETGNALPICIAALKRLRTYPSDCGQDVLSTMPEFSSVIWVKVQPAEHLQLITRLLRYRASSADYKNFQLGNDANNGLLEQVKRDAHVGNIELEVANIRLLDYFDLLQTEKTPPGDQMLVRLSRKTIPNRDLLKCPSGEVAGWDRPVFLVLPDMTGPDVRLDSALASELQRDTVAKFNENFLFVTPDSIKPVSGYVSEDNPLCSFRRM